MKQQHVQFESFDVSNSCLRNDYIAHLFSFTEPFFTHGLPFATKVNQTQKSGELDTEATDNLEGKGAFIYACSDVLTFLSDIVHTLFQHGSKSRSGCPTGCMHTLKT